MNFDDLDKELAELLAAEGSTVDTTPVIDETNHPGPDCPPWCVMGVDGACVSEFRDAPEPYNEMAKASGGYIYTRQRRQPSGVLAVELAVHKNTSGGTTITVIMEQGSELFDSLLTTDTPAE